MLQSTQLVRIPSRIHTAGGPGVSPSPITRDGIPHVFVFPPEEERTETPPWCCFNPTDDPDSDYSDSEHSDVQFIDVALEFMHDHAGDDANVAPIFTRASMENGAAAEASVAPRKEKRSASVLNFMSYGGGVEGRQHGGRELPEDVVEVFKVRRSESKQEMPPTRVKRSKSLKMPFQRALRSIKNVGRSSSSKQTSATKTIPAAKPAPVQPRAQEEIEPPTMPRSRSTTPMLSRRPSQRLASMFSKRNRSNADLVASFADPSSSQLPPNSQSSPQLRGTSSPVVVDDLGAFVPDPSSSHEDPTASIASRKSAKRFSVLDLHRVFTFSPSPPSPAPDEDAPQDAPQNTPAQDLPSLRTSQDAPSLPTLSHEGDSALSTASEEEPPHSPVTNENEADVLPVASKIHWRTSAEMQRLEADVPYDASFELRLDSFHFDALSFDPEEFDVSVALDGQRRG